MNKLEKQNELESLIHNFKDKWKTRFKEANCDSYKFYRKNACEIMEDLYPIYDLAYIIDVLEGIEKSCTIDEFLNKHGD